MLFCLHKWEGQTRGRGTSVSVLLLSTRRCSHVSGMSVSVETGKLPEGITPDHDVGGTALYNNQMERQIFQNDFKWFQNDRQFTHLKSGKPRNWRNHFLHIQHTSWQNVSISMKVCLLTFTLTLVVDLSWIASVTSVINLWVFSIT